MQKEDKMKEERFKKVDDDVWDDIVARMKKRERKQMEFKTRELDASDYHKDHPYMKSLDKALKQYSVVKVNDAKGAHHGPDYEEMKAEILNSLFHPQAEYDKRVESPNKK